MNINSFQVAKDISRCFFLKVSKGAKIRNRYNQVPHLAHNTNGKVTNSQLDTTNESQKTKDGSRPGQPKIVVSNANSAAVAGR